MYFACVAQNELDALISNSQDSIAT